MFRNSPRPMSEYGIASLMDVEAKRPENARYTQLPSYELGMRRPRLDPEAEDHARVLRRARISEGVSFCEPINPDWEW